MSDTPKNVLEIKDSEGKVIGWTTIEEVAAVKDWEKEMHERFLFYMMYGFPEKTEEEKYLAGIRAVITKERGLVYQHDDGKLYETDLTCPALRIHLVEIEEKLTVIRGATSFDF
jgi:hypothetical protein